MNFSTGAIEKPVTKNVNKYGFKIHRSGKDTDSGGEWHTNSVATFHKCGKKGYIKNDFKFNRNGSDGDSSERLTIKLPKLVTKKPIFQMCIIWQQPR